MKSFRRNAIRRKILGFYRKKEIYEKYDIVIFIIWNFLSVWKVFFNDFIATGKCENATLDGRKYHSLPVI